MVQRALAPEAEVAPPQRRDSERVAVAVHSPLAAADRAMLNAAVAEKSTAKESL